MRYNKEDQMMSIEEFDELVFKKKWDWNGKEITDLNPYEQKLMEIDKETIFVKDKIRWAETLDEIDKLEIPKSIDFGSLLKKKIKEIKKEI